MVEIRVATAADVDAICDVYNEAIQTTTATFDTSPRTREQQQQWFEAHGPRYPVLVAIQDGVVVGWVCLTKWSDRPAYDITAETSFYVRSTHRGQGIGRRLKQAIIDEARRLGFHSLIARVAEGSDASMHLNYDMGFQLVGTLKQVGRKFNRLLDVHILQKLL